MAVPVYTLWQLFRIARTVAKWRKGKRREKELHSIQKEAATVSKAMDFLGWLVKLGLFKKYRGKIGATAIAISATLSAFLSPDMIEAWPVLANAPEWLLSVGAYFGIVGARFKDD